MNKFLESSEYVDYEDESIVRTAKELFKNCISDIDKTKTAFEFVRDKIPHSFDIKAKAVTAKASDVLKNKTGICHAKANLLAALLRSQGIMTGFCFQCLTLADDDSMGYCIHGYNAVFLNEHWIKLDARGNKEGVNAQFSTEKEQLAFSIHPELGEEDGYMIYASPDEKILEKFRNNKTRNELWKDLPTKLAER